MKSKNSFNDIKLNEIWDAENIYHLKSRANQEKFVVESVNEKTSRDHGSGFV